MCEKISGIVWKKNFLWTYQYQVGAILIYAPIQVVHFLNEQ
jgi:hypothetical protein